MVAAHANICHNDKIQPTGNAFTASICTTMMANIEIKCHVTHNNFVAGMRKGVGGGAKKQIETLWAFSVSSRLQWKNSKTSMTGNDWKILLFLLSEARCGAEREPSDSFDIFLCYPYEAIFYSCMKWQLGVDRMSPFPQLPFIYISLIIPPLVYRRKL